MVSLTETLLWTTWNCSFYCLGSSPLSMRVMLSQWKEFVSYFSKILIFYVILISVLFLFRTPETYQHWGSFGFGFEWYHSDCDYWNFERFVKDIRNDVFPWKEQVIKTIKAIKTPQTSHASLVMASNERREKLYDLEIQL